MFQLNDVRYKDILDIKEVSIKPNKVTAIIGASGSGKTTLVKLFNQLISQDSGSITYNDKPIEELDTIELRKEVVMLSQTPAIFEGNIRDNLLIGLTFSGKEAASDEDLKKTLKMVKLDKQLDDDAESLSGGEKQRVAFARVILMDAPVYLLDEPTSALDDETEAIVMDRFIEEARKNSKSVIMITHSKKVAEDYSDEIIQMSEINRGEPEHA